jgi:hypothetical protein
MRALMIVVSEGLIPEKQDKFNLIENEINLI